ncbi:MULTISPECIES: TorD/DmsD family molecular chaperone [Bacillus]|uniref:TorD/DmsD family molecular chaperone n=1 Tax=Bacillus TaxID=1386 RepID=UPI0003157DCB|nr:MULTISPECIES: molecular chaperone TorD family protein [Bacillus]
MNTEIRVIQENQINLAFSTSDFYQLLSTSLQLPSANFAEALLDDRYKDDILSIFCEFSISREKISEVEKAFVQLKNSVKDVHHLLKEMRIEHTRLFYHPKSPALNIYETTFLKSEKEGSEKPMLFVSQEASHVEKSYKEAGLIVKMKEPADHIVTEMEFMMNLYGRKAIALQHDDKEGLEKIQKYIKRFEEMHLGKWGYEFFVELETKSTILSYQLIGKLAKIGLGHVLLK